MKKVIGKNMEIVKKNQKKKDRIKAILFFILYAIFQYQIIIYVLDNWEKFNY